MIILVSLMLTLLGTQSSADSDVGYLMTTGSNPAGYTCFDKTEMHSLAKFKMSCDTNSLNYNSLKESYADCMSRVNAPSFFNSGTAITGYIVAALITGFIYGSKEKR